jgi:hypothetical protein
LKESLFFSTHLTLPLRISIEGWFANTLAISSEISMVSQGFRAGTPANASVSSQMFFILTITGKSEEIKGLSITNANHLNRCFYLKGWEATLLIESILN